MQNKQNDRTSDKISAAASGNERSAQRDIPAAARRALAEAEERRRKLAAAPAPEHEIGGRGGKDPVRYGDWEIKGRAIDF